MYSHMKHTSLLLIILFTAILPSHAEQVYKWVDEHGKVHFGDKKPKEQEVEAIDIKIINSIESVTYEDSTIDTGDKVIIYTASWCGYCKKAKKYFKNKGISYTEMDIEKSRIAKMQFKNLGGKGVPMILVGKKKMSGFNEADFARIYK